MKCLRAVAVLALTVTLASLPAAAQSVEDASAQHDPVPTLHVDVRLVNVLISVTDANGAPIDGLGQNDFAVEDNGQPQKIALFERQTNRPLNLVLALDTSGSVGKDLDAERAAARRFAHSILRPQDSMSLIEFATEVHPVVPFTSDVKRIEHGLNTLHRGAATALYEAIQKAAQSLGTRDGRRVLVLVTDGGDTVDTVTYQQALESALRAEVIVYSLIDVPIEASAGRDLGGEHALITLSGQTGGRYFYLDQIGADASFSKISEELRTQYWIGYYPSRQNGAEDFHRITVKIPRAGGDAYQLRYRSGYYSANTR